MFKPIQESSNEKTSNNLECHIFIGFVGQLQGTWALLLQFNCSNTSKPIKNIKTLRSQITKINYSLLTHIWSHQTHPQCTHKLQQNPFGTTTNWAKSKSASIFHKRSSLIETQLTQPSLKIICRIKTHPFNFIKPNMQVQSDSVLSQFMNFMANQAGNHLHKKQNEWKLNNDKNKSKRHTREFELCGLNAKKISCTHDRESRFQFGQNNWIEN